MAEDLQAPILAPTWSTVRETHRMSLAQDAAETREVGLLRDAALPRSVPWGLGFFWPQGTRRKLSVASLEGSSGPLALVSLLDSCEQKSCHLEVVAQPLVIVSASTYLCRTSPAINKCSQICQTKPACRVQCCLEIDRSRVEMGFFLANS